MYDLFSDFFNGFDFFSEPAMYNTKETKCPCCGRTYSDFRESGKLGCGKCYETFRAMLTPTMRQIHQNPTHMGKIPSNSRGEIKLKKRYEELKKQLSDAGKNEDYETAARLHKEIKDIETK